MKTKVITGYGNLSDFSDRWESDPKFDKDLGKTKFISALLKKKKGGDNQKLRITIEVIDG